VLGYSHSRLRRSDYGRLVYLEHQKAET